MVQVNLVAAWGIETQTENGRVDTAGRSKVG